MLFIHPVKHLQPDLECLAVLPAAGIQLEAASFEGNPLADLPHYRAHAIHTLGPSLAVLDNRTVTAEERAAAPGAVGHEATMLALMLSNACLVHKLGRAVQLVRQHCELQAAVLGGRGGGVGGAGVACSGRGTSRMLQLWDYEASMGRQVGTGGGVRAAAEHAAGGCWDDQHCSAGVACECRRLVFPLSHVSSHSPAIGPFLLAPAGAPRHWPGHPSGGRAALP